MRIQPLLALTTFILSGKLAIAAELDPDDVPHPCHSACDPVVSIAQECDRRNDNDTSGMDCICGSDQADTQIPRCEACIAQYRTDHPQDEDNDGDDDDDGDSYNDAADPHDNDAYDILTSCGFDTTSHAHASSSSGGGGGGGSSSHSSSASPSSNSASHSSSASGHIASPTSHSASASSHSFSASSHASSHASSAASTIA
ncbi:putative GPI anchored protein [Aspergillus stella-maris]|uniref:putative GPI anchored protein n=1 Tax=Aspergillus stella-maris TaxID=1810926 RepID=UPI003CCD204E